MASSHTCFISELRHRDIACGFLINNVGKLSDLLRLIAIGSKYSYVLAFPNTDKLFMTWIDVKAQSMKAFLLFYTEQSLMYSFLFFCF